MRFILEAIRRPATSSVIRLVLALSATAIPAIAAAANSPPSPATAPEVKKSRVLVFDGGKSGHKKSRKQQSGQLIMKAPVDPLASLKIRKAGPGEHFSDHLNRSPAPSVDERSFTPCTSNGPGCIDYKDFVYLLPSERAEYCRNNPLYRFCEKETDRRVMNSP